MEEFFEILTTRSSLPDGTIALPDRPPAKNNTSASSSSSEHYMSNGSSNGNGVHHAAATATRSDSSSSSSSNGASSTGRQHEQQQQALELLQERQRSHATTSSSNGNSHNSSSSSSSRGEQHHQDEQYHSDVSASAASLWDEEEEGGGNGVEVELQGVTFGYHADRQVLKGVNITAAPGKSLAVVGPSGSGKSTILKLVTRLYDVTGGEVLVNGVDVRDLTRESLRKAVAVVPQDTVLFNDTILQNIRWVEGVGVVGQRGFWSWAERRRGMGW